MRLIKIGLANINTTVGAVDGNFNAMCKSALQMSAAGCAVGVFPELVLSGYPPEDLLQWNIFIQKQWEKLRLFASYTDVPFGGTVFHVSMVISLHGHLYSVVAVVSNGKILGLVPKENLPTYGVFHEGRVFSPGSAGRVEKYIDDVPFGDLVFKFPFGLIAPTTCEDDWVPDGPIRRRAYSGAELIVNCSASPYRAGVFQTRCEMLATRSGDYLVAHAYVNLIGGNGALVFDGGGFVHSIGRRELSMPRCLEQVSYQVVDLDDVDRARHENTTWRTCSQRYLASSEGKPKILECDGLSANQPGVKYPVPASKSFFLPSNICPTQSPRDEYFSELEEVLVLGLGDYFRKTRAFDSFGIALSGGKDSAVAAVIAYLCVKRMYPDLSGQELAATIRKKIHCFSMPTHFNSDETRTAALCLASELGVSFAENSIEEEFELAVKEHQKMIGPGELVNERTLQNIQARIRGTRMANWSNHNRGMWIQTGNMSEKSTGYTTIYGDMGGAISILGNLLKSVIADREGFLRYLGKKYCIPAIEGLLAIESSAELAKDQLDERELMPFAVLDTCNVLFVGRKLSPVEVYRVLQEMWTEEEYKAMAPNFGPGTLKKWVRWKYVELFMNSIFKWTQSPEALHVGSIDLDRERALQIPTVTSKEWLDLKALEDLTD